MSFWKRNPSPTEPEEAGVSEISEETTPSDGSVRGERGIPDANRTRSLQSRVSSILAVGLMAVLGLSLLVWYYANALKKPARAHDNAQVSAAKRASGEMSLPSLGKIQPPVFRPNGGDTHEANRAALESLFGPKPPLPDGAAPSWAKVRDTEGSGDLPHARSRSTSGAPIKSALERRLSGAVFDSRVQERGTNAEPQPYVAAGSTESNRNEDSDLGARLVPTVTESVQARLLPTQRWLLPKGAFIDCTLETAIDTTVLGMTTCITATDTFSVDGQIVLLERGTKLVGETQGQAQQGSARVFVLWSEARTPSGVVVPLASPGTDELGRSGLPGVVNRHFWDRFGAALLISIIDGAVDSATQSSRGGGNVILNPSSSKDIMTEVLKGTAGIRSTVVKHQGDRIQILVARDLDFRSVYELRTVAAGR